MAAIPQFKMNQNDPTNERRCLAATAVDKQRFANYLGRTTDATPTELFLDGLASPAFRLGLMEDSVMQVRYQGVCVDMTNAAGTQSRGFSGEVTIQNKGGTTALIGAAVVTGVGAGTATLAFTADNTNDALALTVTGVAATELLWEVQCMLVEHSHIRV